MRPSQSASLSDMLTLVSEERIDWSAGYFQQIGIAINHLNRFACRVVTLAEFDADGLNLIRGLMVHLRDVRKLKARTINNYRKSLLALWVEAESRGWMQTEPPSARKLRKLKEPMPAPRAWTDAEMQKIVTAATRVPPDRRGWCGMHWRALIVVAYETSLRIGALMRVPYENFDPRRGTITTPGEVQKTRVETVHRLHPATAKLVAAMPRIERLPDWTTFSTGMQFEDMLFPWPWASHEIHRKYRRILRDAGLPATRRDCFHKLRRTSYTHVFSKFGMIAASEHAGHSSDMSRYYLDKSMLDRPDPLKAIPVVRAK